MVCVAQEERDGIRSSARMVSEVLSEVLPFVKLGISTSEIDRKVEDAILSRGAVPAFKGYRGYPTASCISVNEVVVHGIPSGRALEDGDIVSLDVGLSFDGFFGDVAVTVPIGRVAEEKLHLIDVTRLALEKGIGKAVAGNRLGDVSHSIQKLVERSGLNVVRDFVGHGIGRKLHESPEVPNFGKPHRGPILKEGLVLAIEPMIVSGHYKVEIAKDGWTVMTADRSPAAHFEHMVLIQKGEPEVLTSHPSFT